MLLLGAFIKPKDPNVLEERCAPVKLKECALVFTRSNYNLYLVTPSLFPSLLSYISQHIVISPLET